MVVQSVLVTMEWVLATPREHSLQVYADRRKYKNQLLLLCRAFQAWAEKATHKRDMRQKLLTVSQLFMYGSLARCFQAWQQDTQVCCHLL